MAKKSTLTPEQRAQLVLQVLSKEGAGGADRTGGWDLGADAVPLA